MPYKRKIERNINIAPYRFQRDAIRHIDYVASFAGIDYVVVHSTISPYPTPS